MIIELETSLLTFTQKHNLETQLRFQINNFVPFNFKSKKFPG